MFEKATSVNAQGVSNMELHYAIDAIKMITDKLDMLINTEGQGMKLNKYFKRFSPPIATMNTGSLAGALNGTFYFGKVATSKWEAAYKNGLIAGWYPKNTTAKGIIIHEFGHFITQRIGMGNIDVIVQDLFKKHKKEFGSIVKMRESVSGYAGNYKGTKGNSELFAESFNDYIHNGKSANTIAVELVEEVLRLYKL
jgi:hypothetical protein